MFFERVDYTKIQELSKKMKTSAKILANILLDYARNGGNMDDLTPESIFGKRR